MGFERTQGVVAVVKGEGASKSQELAEALAAGKKIVVGTLQTFPKALDKVRELAATEGKRFAVIADEAHSSQTNETAAKLKEALSPSELAELAGVSDPEQIYILRAKLDGLGFYDSFEVDRVVEVALRGRSQSDLDRALVPVADRLLSRPTSACTASCRRSSTTATPISRSARCFSACCTSCSTSVARARLWICPRSR